MYKLASNYFSDRKATFSVNNYTTEKEIQKGCAQGSCCGPGSWNIMYNSLLNLQFHKRTKVIAFADDVIVLTRGAYKLEAENTANQDLLKIQNWATDNKIEFKDKKAKTLFISRKRNEDKKINLFLNYKKLRQTEEMKYLGIYLDSQLGFL